MEIGMLMAWMESPIGKDMYPNSALWILYRRSKKESKILRAFLLLFSMSCLYSYYEPGSERERLISGWGVVCPIMVACEHLSAKTWLWNCFLPNNSNWKRAIWKKPWLSWLSPIDKNRAFSVLALLVLYNVPHKDRLDSSSSYLSDTYGRQAAYRSSSDQCPLSFHLNCFWTINGLSYANRRTQAKLLKLGFASKYHTRSLS